VGDELRGTLKQSNQMITVVALHHGEVTVKRLASEEGHLVLQPSNPAYKVIEIDEHTAIQGKVIGRIRRPE